MARLSFGVAGALPKETIAEIAGALGGLGFVGLWTNDTPGGDGLAGLAGAAAATETLDLGVGVVPLDRRPAPSVLTSVRQHALPEARLTLGVGSGQARASLNLVEDGVRSLRAGLGSGARIVVGALGPRMIDLAGRVADGVLLNWITAPAAAEAATAVRASAAENGRPTPRVVVYVRVALPAAAPRLREEADRYGRFPAYAAHFRRMGVEAIDTAVLLGRDPASERLRALTDTVDEVVLRALTATDDPRDYIALAAAGAAALGASR